MKTVNAAYLNYLTSPLNGGADDDKMIDLYMEIQNNNPEMIKNLIESLLKPHFENYPPAFKNRTKDSLSYYLSTDKLNFERLFDSNLLPFEHPHNAKLFYLWIWEILFVNEDFKIDNTEKYIETVDVNEPLTLLTYTD